MYAILLILVPVIVTPAVLQSCSELCKLLSSDKSTILRHTNCNCISEHNVEAFQPWTEKGSIVQFDDSGIYYEPAEIYPIHSFSIEHPFYILNPAYRVRIGLKSDDAKKQSKSTSITKEKSHVKHKRKENMFKINTDIDKGLPMYLDIDVEDSTDFRKDSFKEVQTEAEPEDGITEIQTNIKNWKDSSKINNVITQSVDDGAPENIWNEYDSSTENYSNKIMILAGSTLNINERQINSNNKTDVLITPRLIIPSNTINNDDNKDNENYTTHTMYHSTSTQIDQYSKEANGESQIKELMHDAQVATKDDNKQNVMMNENQFHTIPYTTQVSSKLDGLNNQINFKKNSKELVTIQKINNHDTPANIDNAYDITERVHRTKYVPSQNNFSMNRSVYLEKEIKIPRIFTREFQNNSVLSDLNGTEIISNNDFGNDTPGSQELLIVSEANSISINSTVTKDDIKNNTIQVFPNSSEIIGNLYFLFDHHDIPARFRQTPDGQIHIGIDGISMCDKLKLSGNEYILLRTLCDCIQSRNCATISADESKV